MPRPNQVLGLVGTNGIGKSTALKILAGKLKPNLGRFSSPPDWEEILGYFRGSELQVGGRKACGGAHLDRVSEAGCDADTWVGGWDGRGAAGSVCEQLGCPETCLTVRRDSDMREPGVVCAAQNYFTRVLEDDLKAVIKPQYVDHIPKAVRGNVEEVLDGKDARGIKQYLLDHLDLTQVPWGRRGGGIYST
jgi:translation initiation factor RLI1